MTSTITTPADPSPEATVRAFIKAYNDNDVVAFGDLLGTDFTRVSSSTQWRPMSRDGYIDMTRRWYEGFDESRWELIDIVVRDRLVVAEFIETGVFNRPWPITDDRIVQPNGKPYTARATVWFTVNGAGKIATYRYYADDGFGTAYGKEIAASGAGALQTATDA